MTRAQKNKKSTVIVFTDVHGDTHNLLKLVPVMEAADAVLFLGDGISSLEVLPETVTSKLIAVRGNTDFFCRVPSELLVEIGGKNIFITHGHVYGVKSGWEEIARMAHASGAHICLYGHTHTYAKTSFRGVMVINVPPIGNKRTSCGGSYLELVINGDKVTSSVKKINVI